MKYKNKEGKRETQNLKQRWIALK